MTQQWVPNPCPGGDTSRGMTTNRMALIRNRAEDNAITCCQVEGLLLAKECSYGDKTTRRKAIKLLGNMRKGKGYQVVCGIHSKSNHSNDYNYRITIKDFNRDWSAHLYLQMVKGGITRKGNKSTKITQWKGDEKKTFHAIIGQIKKF